MPEDMDSKFRSPGAYDLARFALERLEALRIWPTPLNYELWSHVLADPDSPLAQELERLRVAGEPVTEDLAGNKDRRRERLRRQLTIVLRFFFPDFYGFFR